MSNKIKLKRPIKSIKDDSEISEVTIKDEKEITAYDIYSVTFKQDGTTELGSYAGAIASLCNLTESEVASLHPKDYITLSGEVGKFLE